MAGIEKWLRESDDYPEPSFDPEIVYEDVETFVDPIIVTRSLADLDAHPWGLDFIPNLEQTEFKTTLMGVQVHTCVFCDPGKVYVLDRRNVVDENGLCLVCGMETT
jgi:hypothetical protein